MDDMRLWESGRRVRAAREDMDLSQDDLAEHVDTTQQTISRIENGTQEPRPGLKRRIAEALGTKVAALWPYPDEDVAA